MACFLVLFVCGSCIMDSEVNKHPPPKKKEGKRVLKAPPFRNGVEYRYVAQA